MNACPNCGCRPEWPDASLPVVACLGCGWSARDGVPGEVRVDIQALSKASATILSHRGLLIASLADILAAEEEEGLKVFLSRPSERRQPMSSAS